MEENATKDLNFRRAMVLLDQRIDTPEYLINLWRIMPRVLVSVPPPEKHSPWYEGVEKYLT